MVETLCFGGYNQYGDVQEICTKYQKIFALTFQAG